MAFGLVGSVGTVVQSTSGGSISTLAFGTSETRAAGNLLILYVNGQGSATLPALPSGWSTAVQKAGTSCSSSIFYKIAAGSDAAPTIAAVTSTILSAQLAEFSGNLGATPLDQVGSAAGTTSPIVGTEAAADVQLGELVVAAGGAFYSAAATKTLTHTVNNATNSATTNNATSTADHYSFTWGVTTTKTSADSDSFAFTTTNITGASLAVASFKLAILALARSTADTSLSSDALTPGALHQARSLADASAASDALAPIGARARSVADTSASSDALARSAQPLTRSLADTSASGDAITRASQPLARSTADTSLSSDALAGGSTASRESADTSVSADSIVRSEQPQVRALEETSLSADSLTRQAPLARSLADTTQSFDSLGPAGLFPRVLADNSTSAEDLVWTFSRSLSDQSLSLDSLSAQSLGFRSATDDSLSVDALTGPIPSPREHPNLGGVVNENTTGGVFAISRGAIVSEQPVGGQVLEPLRGGVLIKPTRGGLLIDATRSGTVTEPATGGQFDETATGGEVL